jgi:4-hydroxythreonine-4-phosphate dehydrogenase
MAVRLVLTMGDPAGVGPEIILKSLRDPAVRALGRLLVVGSWSCLRREADRRDSPVNLVKVSSADDVDFGRIGVLDVGAPDDTCAVSGRPDPAGARVAGRAVERAVDMMLAGEADALVTAPLTKSAFREIDTPRESAGWGHTEYLAWRCGVRRFAMMFVLGAQRVLLATTHLPLAAVPGALSRGRVEECIDLLDETLRSRFGLERPRLGVAGLNPHAGEGGLLGREEETFIRPAVVECAGRGVGVTGPLPADTLFWRMSRGEFDGVVALYHDQAMIPVKLLGPERAVNVTVGLPFVRTSVSHGTGFDIAGLNRASERSLIEALTLAAAMSEGRTRAKP